jgi:RES domain-containing protein
MRILAIATVVLENEAHAREWLQRPLKVLAGKSPLELTHTEPGAREVEHAAWVKQARTPVLRVPSAVTRGEFNYVLNPRHSAFAELRIGKAASFSFDHRAL